MLNDKEMKIMLWIMIEEIVHYYHLNKKTDEIILIEKYPIFTS
jgi:hypothetical protein